MADKLTPLQTKVIEALASNNNRLEYQELMHLIWPPAEFPKAYNYSANGGPPGVSMSLGRVLRQLKKLELIDESFSGAGRRTHGLLILRA